MNKQTVKVQIDNIQWPDIQNLSTSCVKHILKHCKPDSKIVFDISDYCQTKNAQMGVLFKHDELF